eukprot:373766-Amphidinium_carterae.1
MVLSLDVVNSVNVLMIMFSAFLWYGWKACIETSRVFCCHMCRKFWNSDHSDRLDIVVHDVLDER